MSILGKVLADTSHTLVYTCPANRRAVATLNVANIDAVEDDIYTTISIKEATDYKVSSITILNGGNDHTVIPNITIENATGIVPVQAEATVTSMEVKTLLLGSIGQGYNIGNLLTFADPSNVGEDDVQCQITITSVDGSGGITSFTITRNGSYEQLILDGEEIQLLGGTGTGATVNGTNITYGILTVQVVEQGADYLEVPAVSIDTGTATLEAVVIDDSVSKYDAIDFNVPIPLHGSLERSPIMLGAGDALFVSAGKADSLNVILFGIEEIA